MLEIILRWLLKLDRLLRLTPPVTLTGKDMKKLFNLDLPEGKTYYFTPDELHKFILNYGIDPSTKPLRERIKTRINYICSDVHIHDNMPWGESGIVDELSDIVNELTNDYVQESIEHIGDDREMLDVLGNIMGIYCVKNEQRCFIKVDGANFRPLHLILFPGGDAEEPLVIIGE